MKYLILSFALFLGLPGGTPTLTDRTPETHRTPETRKVQIALLLDTSNSMDGLIEQAKATLWNLVNEFGSVRCPERRMPVLEIALYEYGNDGLDAQEGYIRQVMPFSRDLDLVSERLFGLRTNGGEEYCGAVIQKAMRQLTWSSGQSDLRFVFIAGNEPFNQGGTSYRNALENSTEKDVVVNTIFCGDYQLGVQTLWAEGARLGKGQYSSIDQNREVVHISTPYDQIIIRLNSRLNRTYIGYGQAGASRKKMQAAQDTEAEEMAEAVMVARAVSKSNAFYSNESWDLVDAASQPGFDADQLDKSTLPDSLRTLGKAEFNKRLDRLRTEREQLQKEIRDTQVKREAYLRTHTQEAASELQNALLDAIREQAARKHYTWEKP